MNLTILDNIIKDPKEYVSNIHLHGFQDIADGQNIFRNIQIRDNNDEFAEYIKSIFPDYEIAFNFVRKSPLNQEEPNFIHTDEMMGLITCILYLNEKEPVGNGTTIYDDNKNILFTMHSKFNRLFCFDSDKLHSRNILENFGDGDNARLVQVIFLK